MLAQLYQVKRDVGGVVREIAPSRGLTADFVRERRERLKKVVEDPDSL